jgi:hypothetical protein
MLWLVCSIGAVLLIASLDRLVRGYDPVLGWVCALWMGVGSLGTVAILVGFSRSYRRARRKANLCVNCGYDLRGTPGSNCPECGTNPYISK